MKICLKSIMTNNLIILIMFFISVSCEKKSHKFHEILKSNLKDFDLAVINILNKYPKRKNLVLIPSKKMTEQNEMIIYDTSIYQFCTKYDINTIEIKKITNNESISCQFEFYIADNNIRYLYKSDGFSNNDIVENNKIIVIPINKFWQFNEIQKEW